MKRIDGIIRGYHAVKHDLPPLEKRPNKDTVPSFERWILHLPGQHPLWSDYALLSCSLAEFPGVPKAEKHFPEATHEVSLFAIDPSFPRESLERGGIQILEPVNYCVQLATTDDKFRNMVEQLVLKFINGEFPAEPDGICVGGRPFREWVREWCEEVVKA